MVSDEKVRCVTLDTAESSYPQFPDLFEQIWVTRTVQVIEAHRQLMQNPKLHQEDRRWQKIISKRSSLEIPVLGLDIMEQPLQHHKEAIQYSQHNLIGR